MCHANPHKQAFKTSQAKHWLIYTSIALLAACGSQESTNSDTKTPLTGVNIASTAPDIVADNTVPVEPSSDSKLLTSLATNYPNGQLPAKRVAQAAADLLQNPAALNITAGNQISAQSQSIQAQSQLIQPQSSPIQAQATSADYAPVQRIQNTTLYGAYFFSIYPGEVTTALATNPNWALEGPAFWASLATGTDLHPVHRFQNKLNGSYLYTIYDSERANIVANYAATFAYEGVAWNARQTTASGWSALYRFRNKTNGTYLFSAFESEKDAIVANYPTVFELEGVAYYVRQDAPIDFVFRLPDTGITISQCYRAGSNVLSSCAGSRDPTSANGLNNRQDGMLGLDVTTPAAADGKLGFSYSEVPNPAGGNFPKADCVKDNLTGLVWEVKTNLGLRGGRVTYTNYDSTTTLQKSNGVGGYIAPTTAEVNATTNSIGYKNAINANSLCGYSDWRLPTPNEVISIMDFGVAFPGPAVDPVWLPNVAAGFVWAATPSHLSPQRAWLGSFDYGGVVLEDSRDLLRGIVLVRGTTVNSQYIVSANGQEVTDSQTGLVWRRCSEGQTWSGSTCTGFASGFTHEAALSQATAQTFATNVAWRLPNFKELSSIANRASANPTIDTSAFPSTPSAKFWSSTPYIGDPYYAKYVDFSDGTSYGGNYRPGMSNVRLVRSSP